MSDTRAAPDADLPDSLWRDRSYWGMTATQFLGAFNDNLFKQVVLLLCIDFARDEGTRDYYQPYAQALFALPFVLFSGFAGYLSDRISKRRIVVLCKIVEIGIVCLGTWSLSSGSLAAVFTVLFLLGTHSAFFGPSKFGILPELVREPNLPAANGFFLMTTFAAIILGTVLAGKLKAFVGGHILIVATAYISVAATGLLTSLLIRKTPVARPGLEFEWSDLAVSGETLKMFWRDRPLLRALVMYSVFWLIGGLTLSAVNAFGKYQLFHDLSTAEADDRTSKMTGFLIVGIALGCATAGWLSGKKTEFRLVPWGSWGMVVGLALVSVLGWFGPVAKHPPATLAAAGSRPSVDVAPEALLKLNQPSEFPEPLPVLSRGTVEMGSKWLLVLMGTAAGVFTVPLQVFLQARPPADQKGRVIGAMNLVNWLGILFSAQIYASFDYARDLAGAPHCAVFGGASLLLLPVALFYRPRETPRPNFTTR